MSTGRGHHQARAEKQMAFSDNQTSMCTSQCPKVTVLKGDTVQDLWGAEGGTVLRVSYLSTKEHPEMKENQAGLESD